MFSREVVSDSCDPIDCSPQAPLSMGFSRQEDWGRIKPVSPALAGGFFTIEPPGKPIIIMMVIPAANSVVNTMAL